MDSSRGRNGDDRGDYLDLIVQANLLPVPRRVGAEQSGQPQVSVHGNNNIVLIGATPDLLERLERLEATMAGLEAREKGHSSAIGGSEPVN